MDFILPIGGNFNNSFGYYYGKCYFRQKLTNGLADIMNISAINGVGMSYILMLCNI